MSLGSASSIAFSGLKIASKSAEVSAHNVANAGTPHFARRSVAQSAMTVGPQGAGVRFDGVDIAKAEALTDDRRRADAEYGEKNELANAAASIARIFGGVDDPSALTERVRAFETALRDLAEDPSASHRQVTALTHAKSLTEALHEASGEIQALRRSADQAIAQQVATVNRLLVGVDAANDDVTAATASGGDAAEAIGARDRLIDELSEIIPVKIERRSGEAIAVTTLTGFRLVDGTVAVFDFQEAVAVTSAMDYAGGAPGSLSGLTIDGNDFTPPGDETGTVGSGSLAGLFRVRDVLGVDAQLKLDALANDIIERFSGSDLDPTLASVDAPGLFTDDGGAVTGAPGAAERIALNAAVDPDQGGERWRLRDGMGATTQGVVGDNTLIVAMLDAMQAARPAPSDSDVLGDASAFDLAAGATAVVASQAETAQQSLAMRASRRDTLASAETEAVGVDIDYELQQLSLIQTAYSANARVLNAIDEMMSILFDL